MIKLTIQTAAGEQTQSFSSFGQLVFNCDEQAVLDDLQVRDLLAWDGEEPFATAQLRQVVADFGQHGLPVSFECFDEVRGEQIRYSLMGEVK